MRPALLVPVLLCMALSGAAADTDEWGHTIDGLRLSLAIFPDSHADLQVRVTVNYLGRSPVLLPLGFATGDRISRHRLRLLVAAADGRHSFTLDDPVIPIRGRFDPISIAMIPHARYTLELSAADWYPAWNEGLSPMTPFPALLRQPTQLWVEWDCAHYRGTAPSCPLYGYPNPNQFACWEGKLVSNILHRE